jgi:hypothetical protein
LPRAHNDGQRPELREKQNLIHAMLSLSLASSSLSQNSALTNNLPSGCPWTPTSSWAKNPNVHIHSQKVSTSRASIATCSALMELLLTFEARIALTVDFSPLSFHLTSEAAALEHFKMDLPRITSAGPVPTLPWAPCLAETSLRSNIPQPEIQRGVLRNWFRRVSNRQGLPIKLCEFAEKLAPD